MRDIRYYIDEQCTALAHILAERRAYTGEFVHRVMTGRPDRLYLIGSGTSCNAAMAAAPFMEEVLGVEVTACAPSQVPRIRGERPLIVLVSQGGTSTNILQAIERLGGYDLLALTGREQCRVNEVCGSHVLLGCGEETVGPKTKGYTCTVLTLYLMAMEAALALGKLDDAAYEGMIASLRSCIGRLPGQIQKAEAAVNAHAAWMMAARQFVVVGKGLAGIAAKECVIKLVETMLTPAAAYEFEEYLHGPISLMDKGLGGVYLLPPEGDPDRPRMMQVAQFHADRAGNVLMVEPEDGEAPRLPGYAHVFAWVLPGQMMAALLPQRMGVEGRGEAVFYAVDKLVNIKYGHVV